jgi:hypothetical protein
MTNKHEVLDRFGNKIEEDRPLRDGERIKVGVLLMDSASPDIAAITRQAMADAGDGRMTDDANAAREQIYHDRDDRLSNAWRNPPAQDAPAATTPATATVADVEAALAQRDQRLTDAWRNA